MLALAAPASTSCRTPPAAQELQLLGVNQSLTLKPGFSFKVDVFYPGFSLNPRLWLLFITREGEEAVLVSLVNTIRDSWSSSHPRC